MLHLPPSSRNALNNPLSESSLCKDRGLVAIGLLFDVAYNDVVVCQVCQVSGSFGFCILFGGAAGPRTRRTEQIITSPRPLCSYPSILVSSLFFILLPNVIYSMSMGAARASCTND